jgi:hypothetical protein
MQYINLAIHALTPAVSPSPAACLGRVRNGGTVISIFSPLLFKPLSNNPPHLDTKINKSPSSFNHAVPIQLILKIMKYIALLQYFNKI